MGFYLRFQGPLLLLLLLLLLPLLLLLWLSVLLLLLLLLLLLRRGRRLLLLLLLTYCCCYCHCYLEWNDEQWSRIQTFRQWLGPSFPSPKPYIHPKP